MLFCAKVSHVLRMKVEVRKRGREGARIHYIIPQPMKCRRIGGYLICWYQPKLVADLMNRFACLCLGHGNSRPAREWINPRIAGGLDEDD